MPRRFFFHERADPWIIVIFVAAMRIPFFARTLYEFDSVNYAIGMFHFDLSQDTPHFPGYLLHIGIARALLWFTHDVNGAFVWESFLLSIGSVLFVWYAVRIAVGRGAAFAAASVWACNPIFWFYGCVATVYPHEAFFTAALAALGIRYVADGARAKTILPFLMALTVGVAGAARPSSILFFVPALVILLWRVHAPGRIWTLVVFVLTACTAVWVGILLSFTDGLAGYVAPAYHSTVLLNDSIFLHGTLQRHAAMLGKMLLYSMIGTAPFWTAAVYLLLRNPAMAWRIARRGMHSITGMFLAVLAAVPFAFYALIFYAKPGYLLNIFVIAAIGTGLLIDKLKSDGIIGGFSRWAIVWCVAWMAYFTVPMPWKSPDAMRLQAAIGSTANNTAARYPGTLSKLSTAVVKLFTYASSAGIASVDDGNGSILASLVNLRIDDARKIIISSQWGQWAMFYLPQATVYNCILLLDAPALVYHEHAMIKKEVTDSVIVLPSDADEVVIQIWRGHWAFPDISRQVHLEQLPTATYDDEWRITDAHFRLTLGGKTFIR